jgi:predicted nucleic acid-binding protein
MPVHLLSMLPAGREILIDANVLVYGLLHSSAQCRALLQRCLARDVAGFTTVEILADVCHKIMLAEAFSKGLIARANASSLQGKTTVVTALKVYWQLIDSLPVRSLAVLPYDEFRFRRAHMVRQAHGLMTNDSAIVAAADVFGIPALATNDDDFDAIPWIDVYKPTDLARASP